jgi:hypothetical protein
MGIARLVKWIGVIALLAGIIGFLLPGEFVLFPQLSDMLTTYGDALFNGISSNPMVKMFIVKAPVIGLVVIGFGMVFWGMTKELMCPDETPKPACACDERSTKKLVDAYKAGETRDPCRKSVRELVDRKKP